MLKIYTFCSKGFFSRSALIYEGSLDNTVSAADLKKNSSPHKYEVKVSGRSIELRQDAELLISGKFNSIWKRSAALIDHNSSLTIKRVDLFMQGWRFVAADGKEYRWRVPIRKGVWTLRNPENEVIAQFHRTPLVPGRIGDLHIMDASDELLPMVLLTCKLVHNTVKILDGGSGQLIADMYPDLNTSNDGLWSSGVAVRSPDIIKDIHIQYLQAGAEIICTATYQASAAGYIKAGLASDREGVVKLMEETLKLAVDARNQFMQCSPPNTDESKRPLPLIAVSLGSIGAVLGNYSEYSGKFGSDITFESIQEFHRDRLAILAECLQRDDEKLLKQIDLLAFETIPSADEAAAIISALDWIKDSGLCLHLPPAWISFTFKSGASIASGEAIEKVAKVFNESPHIWAVGVNCVNIYKVDGILNSLCANTQKPIVCYPNGQNWTSSIQDWGGCSGGQEATSPSDFAEQAARWVSSGGASVVGGCCKTTPKHIAALAKKFAELRHT
ncbi:Catalyzes methyl transfer from S-methylmethionine (SMM) to adenosyl-L-homocysteine (AdoMet) [Coemansia sp. Benny D115]|nr:Catalyzes methyl transfer from S-methylmethionine (SMM) to adenosyl-L-homocysteine (AdoMet) [Coemansia sp. Benny D115]